ncbi:flagellar protein MotY [Enterovibrio norvegicus FF-454]|uniref:Flagellar protein MotY n=2 Tax=Enterovibrio norvegicus TaxID=188144 RepID=A0A1E5BYS9_9GAMM|nr:OmpA family protein [Enterovibrio norvegicus]OEE58407.1 flagellar protein MotY [Enterovibrio norvegicus FF-454]
MDLSSWKYQGGKFECQLIHAEVPQGKFYFRALPGEKLSFESEWNGNNTGLNVATLYQVAPPWLPDARERKLADVNITANSIVRFQHQIPELLKAMAASQWVNVAYSGGAPSVTKSITLPTIRIQQSLTAFNRCRANLPGMSVEEARTLELPFAFGQRSLTFAQQNKLKALSSYLAVDASISRILIDGHTDNIGSSVVNLNTSRQRAENVASALQTLGVADTRIDIRAHGERYPIADNVTQKGQAKNRRVTVRLVRDSERVVPVLLPAQQIEEKQAPSSNNQNTTQNTTQSGTKTAPKVFSEASPETTKVQS